MFDNIFNLNLKFFIIFYLLQCIAACATNIENTVETKISETDNNSTTMSYKIEAIPNSDAELIKGPQWDADSQNLYMVYLTAGMLMRYDYQENKVYRCQIEGETLAAFIVPIEGVPDEFAVGCGRRVVIVKWDGVAETCKIDRILFEVQTDEKFVNNRLNDGKCDPRGRLFAGTMRAVGNEFEYRHGELYKYEPNGKILVVKSDVGISNGVAWNEKANKFYYIDTADYEVKEYDYNFDTGTASNPRVVHDFRKTSVEDHLLPDGMTIDTDGNIYVTTYNGYTIYKINPTTGEILLEIKFPCKQITSAAFGGPNMDILFVTTSARPNEPPPAGTTFKVTGLGAKGLPTTKLKIFIPISL